MSGLVIAIVAIVALVGLIGAIVTVAAIAVPRLSRSQQYARETAAIQSMTIIHRAQTQYFAQYGRFAASLTELGPPAGGEPSAAAADLIGVDLALGEKSGYRFTVTGSASGYLITAAPVSFGITGRRSFTSDQRMVIRQNPGPVPDPANGRELGAR